MWKFFTNSGIEKIEDQPETPAGLITSFAGSSAPIGWLLCQGQELSRSTYPKLDAALGQMYGAYTNGSGASGNTHFKVPDLRSLIVAGIYAGAGEASTGTGAPSGTSMTDSMLGTTTGVSTVTLSSAQSGIASHTHTPNAGSHTHPTTSAHTHTFGNSAAINYETSTGSVTATNVSGTGTTYLTAVASTGATFASATSGISFASAPATAASASHSNEQPYLTLHFAIYTG